MGSVVLNLLDKCTCTCSDLVNDSLTNLITGQIYDITQCLPWGLHEGPQWGYVGRRRHGPLSIRPQTAVDAQNIPVLRVRSISRDIATKKTSIRYRLQKHKKFMSHLQAIHVVYLGIFWCMFHVLAARVRTPWRIFETTWLLPPKYTCRLENTTWCRRHHVNFGTSWCRTWTRREIYTYQTCIHVATWSPPRTIFANRDGNGCFLLGYNLYSMRSIHVATCVSMKIAV